MVLQLLLYLSLVFSVAVAQEADPLDVQLGEKLFMEGRLAQGYYEKAKGDINSEVSGDPVLDEMESLEALWQHPHKGRQISCSSCHMVDQNSALMVNSVLTYNDFARTSKIPLRPDKVTHTVRNSMNLVAVSLGGDKPLHWDGEFSNSKSLACAAMVGRNMGWLNGEQKSGREHIVRVLRGDNGSYPTDSNIKESYTQSFKQFGYDFSKMTDQQVYDSACDMMARFMNFLDFSKDDQGFYNASAYDQFLALNDIRRGPKEGESHLQYLTYLRDHINFKTDWKWLEAKSLQYHKHDSKFGPQEFQGLQLFFGRAQCVTCHTPPEFTDYLFHNTGIAQFEYEAVHGRDSFKKLDIPSWGARQKNREKYMVSSQKHPDWQGVFRQKPSLDNPEFADLGVYNILGHPDMVDVQKSLKEAICASYRQPGCQWGDGQFLYKSVGLFKTPTLRGLGQSAPYLHDGLVDDLEQVVHLYLRAKHMESAGKMVNVDPFIRAIQMQPPDFATIKRFLLTLDEDYD